MADHKKSFLAALSLIAIIIWSLTPQVVYGAQSKYYDFGPYYQQPQVLGVSFSALENLPAPTLPDNLIPPPATGLMPDSPFYFLEQATENVQLLLTPDPVKKEELRLEFAQERLEEAKTLMEQGKTEAASVAMDNYGQAISTVAQSLSSLAEKNDPATQALADKVEEATSAHAVITQTLALSSPPAQAEIWALGVEATRTALDHAADVKGTPPIPEELSTNIQGLKEQGLLSEEESNKLYSFKSRSEVREELDKLVSSGQFPLAEIVRLDEAVTSRYPDVAEQHLANIQVAELKTYQTLPQPSEAILGEIERWQGNPSVPPPNDIKPYLWYNRAQDLAGEVDLSNFSEEQQADVARFYPAVADNPTYVPLPSPSPSPSPSPAGEQASAQPTTTDQSASPSAVSPSPVAVSPSPTSGPPPAQPYLGDTGGALPGEPFYFFKQAGEQLAFTFTFDPAQKAQLRMQHAERRLAEAAALSGDPAKASLYEATINSYQQAMNDASTQLKNAGDTETARATAERLENQAARHEVVLEKGLLPSPTDSKVISEAIKATENAMDRSADVLDKPALPPALASRLGDLKAQGLILAEEAEDLVRSNSREEVREKIRKLVDIGTFPPADAKKLDEAQALTSLSDYNQLVEVRKVEELQSLRAVQTDLAQTPTLKSTGFTLTQRENLLANTIDPSTLTPEDLAGNENLLKTYRNLVATASARPINSGQFGPEATPGAKLAPPAGRTPGLQDAVSTTCPAGATWNQFAGCVWADSGRAINDYEQYKCAGPRQYYSFAANKCLAYEPGAGFKEDGQPICPVGYSWSWQRQSCQGSSIGGIFPLPSPQPEPSPKDEKEIAERSKSCPHGSSYKASQGCVWDKDDEPIYNSSKYRCGQGEYYSFEKLGCVSSPKPGETYPGDAVPSCKDAGSIWSWAEGKCTPIPQEVPPSTELAILKPTFVTPGNPFYFLKQAGEAVQRATAFTPQARGQVSLSQAKERLAEAFDALKKDDDEAVKKAISSYTATMQNLVGDLSREQLTNQAKNEIGQLLAKEAVDQNLLLQKLSALAPAEQDTAINAAVSTTILGVDKAADIAGEPPIPAAVKEKIAALPEDMISAKDKKKILEADSRVEARLGIGGLATNGILTQNDSAFLNEDFAKVSSLAKIKVEEITKLEELSTIADNKGKIEEKVEKNEDIERKLQDFERTFEPGNDVPAEIRPYVRYTRINEVAQTVRPDIVNLSDFANRKDLILAVATLQEEFRPTRQAIQQVEDFRRRNPNAALPFEFARIAALSINLGAREQAGPCYLPTPPFPANTPCPAPGAAIPINSTWYGVPRLIVDPGGPGLPGGPPLSVDKDGKPLVYGQGPKPESAGVCSDGYHWMYDSGGWCMSNSGNYNSSYNYTPTGTGPGYTPYSPYYTAPGAPPGSYGYNDPNFINLYSPLPGGPTYNYSPPYYYGTAPTNYTTTPPAGTVPGTGPAPTSPGQCPSGYHWMSDSGGWCMSNGNTYVPGGGYGGPNQPSPNLTAESCGPGYTWTGNACYPNYSGPGGSPYSPNLTQSSCGPGYYWDGRGCIRTSPTDTYGSCSPPGGGCGSNSYWDYGSCSCRSTSGPILYNPYPPTSSCTQQSCGSGQWFDWGTCSCRPTSGSGPTSGSCPAGSHWMSDNGGYCMSDGGGSTSTSTSTTPSTSTSSGSCPSGYHWMSDSGGWCMSDGATGSTSTSTSTSPSTSTTTTTTTSEPAPAPSTSTTTTTTTESSPPPPSSTTTTTTTESSPPPSSTTTSP